MENQQNLSLFKTKLSDIEKNIHEIITLGLETIKANLSKLED